VRYDQRAVQLQPGDLVLLYTDGVTDALDAQGREFGFERLRRMVLDHRRASAAQLTAALDGALIEFAGAAPYDDITVVAARRL
jgi:sigma-B regulation protein RsbU (phosphoserine phosphatase)